MQWRLEGCRKLRCQLFAICRGPRYFEVDLDVSSSSVAANIVGLVQGMTKSLCVDMAIVLEGHSPEELPECLLGTVRCSHLDLSSAKLLDVETGRICWSMAIHKPRPALLDVEIGCHTEEPCLTEEVIIFAVFWMLSPATPYASVLISLCR